MEPTIQSTIQQQPTEGNRALKFMTLMIVGVLGLIGAFFIVRNTIRVQNRAATTPPVPSCVNNSTGSGYCEIPDETQLQGRNLDGIFMDIVEKCTGPDSPIGSAYQEKVLYRMPLWNSLEGKINKYSDQFDVKPNCTYECRIVIGDGAEKICPISDSGSLACLPTPTPECKEDCLDGSFKCTQKPEFLKPGEDSSCPALDVETINYTGPKAGVCPASTPGQSLDCDNDKVVIETNEPGKTRELTKAECLELKKTPPEGFLMRLHTAFIEGCRTYNIVAYHKDGSKLKVCENCQLKTGCPASCVAPVELTKDQLIDITINSKKDKLPAGSNVECGIIPGTTTNCDVVINQNLCGKTMTFTPKADGTLYLDDHYNDKPKVVIPVKKDVPITYTYDNAGYYDVVLSCGDPENNKIEAVCAKRVTVACKKGGGGGGGTPAQPTPTSSLSGSPAPSPTPGKCPVINISGICI